MSRKRSEGARVAYFGGSFDPVHLGHLSVAEDLLRSVPLDELVFLPAGRSPFKPDGTVASTGDRLAMLLLAVAGEARYSVDPRELERAGPSYTADTMSEIAGERPEDELFFVIGRDNLEALPRWRDIERLARVVEFLVAGRDGAATEREIAALPDFIRARAVATRLHPASSTTIRTRLESGRDVSAFLPAAVDRYARSRRIYSPAPPRR
ncbi:MAG: nicotinate-nucleotide adenylyltransferase [Planctomycetota bacterium]